MEVLTRGRVGAAYRGLVLQYHPDKCKGCTEAEAEERSEKFIRVQKAYEKLGGHDARDA